MSSSRYPPLQGKMGTVATDQRTHPLLLDLLLRHPRLQLMHERREVMPLVGGGVLDIGNKITNYTVLMYFATRIF
jgi:hypothetical protein